jgi:hypothetical protein
MNAKLAPLEGQLDKNKESKIELLGQMKEVKTQIQVCDDNMMLLKNDLQDNNAKKGNIVMR